MKRFARAAWLAIVGLALASSAGAVTESKALFDLSPDGSRLLLADFQGGELWLYNFHDNTTKNLVTLKSARKDNQTVRLFAPQFSPDLSTIVFASYDESKSSPVTASLWRVEPDGGQFKLIAPFQVDTSQESHLFGTPVTFTPDGRRLEVTHFDPKNKQVVLDALNLTGGDRGRYVWQDGVVASQWAPDRKAFAYVARRTETDAATLQNAYDLWFSRADGGQMKKTATVYATEHPEFMPFSWSVDSQSLIYFSQHLDEKLQLYRELEVFPLQTSKAVVLLSTWGFPTSSIHWSRDGKRVAYLETKDLGADKLKLVALTLKWRDNAVIGVKGVDTLEMPAGTQLVGWSYTSKRWLYLLKPSAQDGRYYSLVEQEIDDIGNVKVIVPKVSKGSWMNFDEVRGQLTLCDRTTGCEIVTLPGGDRRFATPNFRTALTAADRYLRMNDYATAEKIYAGLSKQHLERDDLLELMARNYVVAVRTDKSQDADRLWKELMAEIDRSDVPPQDSLLVGRAFVRSGELSLGIGLFQKVIDQHPGSIEARKSLLAMGYAYLGQKEYDFAKNCFANFAKFYPSDPNAPLALVELGSAYLSKQEAGTALKVFQKAAKVGRDEDIVIRALYGRAQAYERLSRLQDARKGYQMVIDRGAGRTRGTEMLVEEARTALKRMSAS